MDQAVENQQRIKSDGGAAWVLHDLKIQFFMSECKALGLICKLITTPLWNLIEECSINIFDMNDRYLQLVNFLEEISEDKMMDFLLGKLYPFPDRPVKDDILFKALIAPSEHNSDCIVILCSILPAIGKLAKRLYHDHLPAGRFEAVPRDVRESARGSAKHNKY